MNTQTGRIYDLHESIGASKEVGELLEAADFTAIKADALSADEAAAELAVRRGEPVVRVSGQVAQAQRVGHKELERRRKRRRAARATRQAQRRAAR